MSSNDDNCLKLCSKGDLDLLKELFNNLDHTAIELIRDQHKARYITFCQTHIILRIFEAIFNCFLNKKINKAVFTTQPDLDLSMC